MQLSPQILALLGVLILLLASGGFVAYVWLCTRIAQVGGKVRVEKYGTVDLLVCGLLMAFFILLAINGFSAPDFKVTNKMLLRSSVDELTLVMLIIGFLYWRGIGIAGQFGLRAVSLPLVPVLGLALVFAAYPMIHCVNALTMMLLKGMPEADAKPQELVLFFQDAVHNHHFRSVALTLFTGAIVAPVVEEFVFRGYIYGVLKHYTGIVAGILLNAALFAAVHVNAPSAPALFMLAIFLTIAYEATGSILVNMCMHSFFNLGQFAVMYLIAYRSHGP